MKILLFEAVTSKGGIQTHMRFLTKILVDSGVKVFIIAPQLVKQEDSNLDELKRNGIKIFFTFKI